MGELRYLPIPEGIVGERADTVLARCIGISRNFAGQILDSQKVYLQGIPIKKSQRVNMGDCLEVEMPAPSQSTLPLAVDGIEIVWEDEHIVVVDKPVGVAAHPSVGWEGPTVTRAIEAAGVKIATSGAQERQGVVSRLDVGTSGIMLVTKTELAYGVMKAQFKHHQVEKIYHAVVQGKPKPEQGTIDGPIGRDPQHQWKMCISNRGKNAITHYKIISTSGSASLLEVRLETGRTHQIRVHMQAIGHPCVADPLYGANPVLAEQIGLERQWIHAYSLGFKHPARQEWITVKCKKYPEDISRSLRLLNLMDTM